MSRDDRELEAIPFEESQSAGVLVSNQKTPSRAARVAVGVVLALVTVSCVALATEVVRLRDRLERQQDDLEFLREAAAEARRSRELMVQLRDELLHQQVPTVVGLPLVEARAILEAAGFRTRVFRDGPREAARVIQQDPVEGTQLRGSTVRLWCCS